MKYTAESLEEVIFNARCCLSVEKQSSYEDFDLENLYAPAVRDETIGNFIVKSAAQVLIVEGVDVDNAYLYGNIEYVITSNSRRRQY